MHKLLATERPQLWSGRGRPWVRGRLNKQAGRGTRKVGSYQQITI
jgi:hypothetical protein